MNGKSILIIGAGILGSTLAAELTARGCRVTLVDQGEPGERTTNASFAWVNAFDKAPTSYAQLNFHGLRAHERWAESSERRWFHQIGNIKLTDNEQRLVELEEMADQLRAIDYPAESVSKQQLEGLLPGFAMTDVLGGVHFSREGWIDTSLMCHSMVAGVVRAGAKFLAYHDVLELTAGGALVQQPDGEIVALSADVTVLAAGNGTSSLAHTLDKEVPILPATFAREDVDTSLPHPTVGLTCITSPFVGLPRKIVQTDGVSMKPSPNGGVTLSDHATASQWDASDPDLWKVPTTLLERARSIYPALESVEIISSKIGHRVLPEDGLTISDWLDETKKHYVVSTHSGVTLAPHLAEVVASELIDGERDQTLSDFGLERFAKSLNRA